MTEAIRRRNDGDETLRTSGDPTTSRIVNGTLETTLIPAAERRAQELAGIRPHALHGASRACRAPSSSRSEDESIERDGGSAGIVLSIFSIALSERRAASLAAPQGLRVNDIVE
jgi:hypothetical protein